MRNLITWAGKLWERICIAMIYIVGIERLPSQMALRVVKDTEPPTVELTIQFPSGIIGIFNVEEKETKQISIAMAEAAAILEELRIVAHIDQKLNPLERLLND